MGILDPVPSDVSKLKIIDFIKLTTAFAIATAVWPFFPPLSIVIASYCIGFCLLVISDSIDNRPMDDRRFLSMVFNNLGILMLVLGFLGMLATAILGIPLVVISYYLA